MQFTLPLLSSRLPEFNFLAWYNSRHSVGWSVGRSVGWSVGRSASQPASQPASQSASQPASQSVRLLFSLLCFFKDKLFVPVPAQDSQYLPTFKLFPATSKPVDNPVFIVLYKMILPCKSVNEIDPKIKPFKQEILSFAFQL